MRAFTSRLTLGVGLFLYSGALSFAPLLIDPTQDLEKAATSKDTQEHLFGASQAVVAYWEKDVVEFHINTAGLSDSLKNSSPILDEITQSIESWNDVDVAIQTNVAGRTNHRIAKDGINSVVFQKDAGHSEAVAYYEKENGVIRTIECDIVINRTLEDHSPDSLKQIISSLTHEVGHCLGLGHSRLLSSVMSGNDPDCFTKRSSKVGADDQVGLKTLYPKRYTTKVIGEVFLEGAPHYGTRIIAIDASSGLEITETYSGIEKEEAYRPSSYSITSGKFYFYGLPEGTYYFVFSSSPYPLIGDLFTKLPLMGKSPFDQIYSTFVGPIEVRGTNVVDMGAVMLKTARTNMLGITQGLSSDQRLSGSQMCTYEACSCTTYGSEVQFDFLLRLGNIQSKETTPWVVFSPGLKVDTTRSEKKPSTALPNSHELDISLYVQDNRPEGQTPYKPYFFIKTGDNRNITVPSTWWFVPIK